MLSFRKFRLDMTENLRKTYSSAIGQPVTHALPLKIFKIRLDKAMMNLLQHQAGGQRSNTQSSLSANVHLFFVYFLYMVLPSLH